MISRKQHIPDIDFANFALGNIKNLFVQNKIYINEEYQRGDVWKQGQKVELIKSIFNSYSIGVLVLYINDKGQFEILDGQQRLLTIFKYVSDKIDLPEDVTKYSELEENDKIFLNGYSVYYLKLKSHNPETKEEDIVQTFLRLQEGSPLNKAEKINAYRGTFKDVFLQERISQPMFTLMQGDKRFRLRLLSAELLLLELESDFKNKIFPSIDLPTFKVVINKYRSKISDIKVKFFRGNLDYIYESMNMMLTALTPRDLIPLYLLISYLRKHRADNSNLKNELSVFIENILQELNSFVITDTKPPKGMPANRFKTLMEYKTQARGATTSESIKYRFDFFLSEFEKQHNIILKDTKRLHDKEQKRILYLRQKGICLECNKIIDFRIDGSAHHVLAHKDGGKTDDLTKAVLLHEKCHQKLEKRISKENQNNNLKLF
jgi:uncharacterized protein with ParB-like and HNH nuclease domain